MTQTIAIEIPDTIAEKYTTLDALKQGLYEDIIVREFQKGHLSIRESAHLLDMTYESFLEWLGEKNLSFISASEAELRQSYDEFETFLQTYEKP